MAQAHRYVRSVRGHGRPRRPPAPDLPPPRPVRLDRPLVGALWVSALFALATLLFLVRSWLMDAPAPEADGMVALGVGGITWLTSLGYYTLWQLDKQLRAPSQDRPD